MCYGVIHYAFLEKPKPRTPRFGYSLLGPIVADNCPVAMLTKRDIEHELREPESASVETKYETVGT
jgi:hypothetical protein